MASNRKAGPVVRAIGAAALIAGLVLLVRWAGNARQEPLPNVILIVLDTLRADRLGVYGNTSGLTPFLDDLAARSLVYERAYAPSSWTLPSIASLFLARYPSEHQLVGWRARLPESQVTLAEVLRGHGYRTVGFSANLQIAAETGFDQGFDEFRLLLDSKFDKGDASQINNAVRQSLARAGDASSPLFLYLQFMEAHGTYRTHGEVAPEQQMRDRELNERLNIGAMAARLGTPSPWGFAADEKRRLLDLYDGEVAYLDSRLRELFALLEAQGILRNAVVIITADHGEEFGEHDVFGHGTTLYEGAVRVPLIIHLPGGARAGRLGAPTQLAGLAPALLRQLGLPVPADYHVAPIAMSGEDPTAAAGLAYSELVPSAAGSAELHRHALVVGTNKLLVRSNGDHLYYDLASDAAESTPLPAASFEVALRQALTDITASMNAPSTVEAAAIDEATRDRLHRLGYGP